MTDTTISFRLEVVAAMARQLAEDHKANKLWPGDLSRDLSKIEEQITAIRGTDEGRRVERY